MMNKLDYAFTKSEIKVLKAIANGSHSLSEIRNATSIKSSLLSYDIQKNLRKGLIKTTKKGSAKYIYFSESKHALLFRTIMSIYDYVDWESILCDLAIDILFQIANESEINFEDFSRVTFWRYVRNLKAHGILDSKNNSYVINPRFSELKEFLIEYQLYLIDTLIKSISERATILWQKDLECLFIIPKNVDVSQENFYRTATSLFHDLGIPLLSEFDVYFFSKNKDGIRIEDAILHTLLLGPNDVRYTLYGLLLMRKEWENIDKEYLLKNSQKLGLSLQINAMLQFLRTQGERKGLTLPSWEEFMAKAREYKVID